MSNFHMSPQSNLIWPHRRSSVPSLWKMKNYSSWTTAAPKNSTTKPENKLFTKHNKISQNTLESTTTVHKRSAPWIHTEYKKHSKKQQHCIEEIIWSHFTHNSLFKNPKYVFLFHDMWCVVKCSVLWNSVVLCEMSFVKSCSVLTLKAPY